MISDIRFLDRVQVASPCPASWEGMTPVDAAGAVRYCGECRLNVYNLSDMTADEAEALLSAHEGKRLCVAFFRRTDGTVLTRDCPVGLRIARRKAVALKVRMAVSLSAVIGSLIVPDIAAAQSSKRGQGSRTLITRAHHPAIQDQMVGSPTGFTADERDRLIKRAVQRQLNAKKAKIRVKPNREPSDRISQTEHTVGKLIAKPVPQAPIVGGAVPRPKPETPKVEPVKPSKQPASFVVGRIAAPHHLKPQNKPGEDKTKPAEPKPGKSSEGFRTLGLLIGHEF